MYVSFILEKHGATSIIFLLLFRCPGVVSGVGVLFHVSRCFRCIRCWGVVSGVRVLLQVLVWCIRCCIRCPGVVSNVQVLYQVSGCCFRCQRVVSVVRVLFHVSGCCFRCQGVVSHVRVLFQVSGCCFRCPWCCFRCPGVDEELRLPSRQMVEFVQMRLRDAACLMCRTTSYASQAAVYPCGSGRGETTKLWYMQSGRTVRSLSLGVWSETQTTWHINCVRLDFKSHKYNLQLLCSSAGLIPCFPLILILRYHQVLVTNLYYIHCFDMSGMKPALVAAIALEWGSSWSSTERRWSLTWHRLVKQQMVMGLFVPKMVIFEGLLSRIW